MKWLLATILFFSLCGCSNGLSFKIGPSPTTYWSSDSVTIASLPSKFYVGVNNYTNIRTDEPTRPPNWTLSVERAGSTCTTNPTFTVPTNSNNVLLHQHAELTGWTSTSGYIEVDVSGGNCALGQKLVVTVNSVCAQFTNGCTMPNSGRTVTITFGNVSKVIFETTSTYNGSMGGVSGADAKCAADTNKPSSGTFKAFIVGTGRVACTTGSCSGGATEHTDWVLGASTPYVRKDGTAIGTTNSSGIFDFPLTAAFATAGEAWTGLGTNWTTANTCTSWSNNGTHPNYGALGAITSTTNTAIQTSNAETCDSTNKLLCVEQ